LLLDWSRWTHQKVIQMRLIGLPVTRLGIIRLTKMVASIKGIITRLGKRHMNQNKFQFKRVALLVLVIPIIESDCLSAKFFFQLKVCHVHIEATSHI